MFNVKLSEQELNALAGILNSHLLEASKTGRGCEVAPVIGSIVQAMQAAEKIEPPKGDE